LIKNKKKKVDRKKGMLHVLRSGGHGLNSSTNIIWRTYFRISAMAELCC
jgi:hypothetical protein